MHDLVSDLCRVVVTVRAVGALVMILLLGGGDIYTSARCCEAHPVLDEARDSSMQSDVGIPARMQHDDPDACSFVSISTRKGDFTDERFHWKLQVASFSSDENDSMSVVIG